MYGQGSLFPASLISTSLAPSLPSFCLFYHFRVVCVRGRGRERGVKHTPRHY